MDLVGALLLALLLVSATRTQGNYAGLLSVFLVVISVQVFRKKQL